MLIRKNRPDRTPPARNSEKAEGERGTALQSDAYFRCQGEAGCYPGREDDFHLISGEFRMRMRWMALLVAGLLVAAVTAGDDAKKERKKLEGTWTAVSMEKDGEKIPDDTVKELKLQVIL